MTEHAAVDWYQEVAGPAPSAAPPESVDWYDEVVKPEAAPKPEADPKVVSDPSKAADVGDIAIASLANEPRARIRWYAEQRGISEDRYKIVRDKIVYRADDGIYYREVPDVSLSQPMSFLQAGVSHAGESIPIVAGATAGIVTAPAMLTGPPGLALSLAATGGAAAGGQAAREGLANYFMDQDVSPRRIAMEGGMAAAGQGIGAGLTSWASRGLARDINRLDPRVSQALERKAAAEDIPLTPAEKTGLPSLKAQQKTLGNLTASSDKMESFYRQRSDNVKQAVRRFLDRVSPIDSAEEAGDLARAASRGAMDRVAANRAAQAKPLYEKAFKEAPEVNVSSVIDDIDVQLVTAKGGIKTALKKARALLMQEVDDIADDGTKLTRVVPEDRLDALHQAKMAIDDMIDWDGTATTSLGKVAKGRLKGIQTRLLEVMDDASQDYQSARAIFADLSPSTVRVSEGLVGKVAGLTERNVKDAARIFLGPNSGPRAVREARRLIMRENPEAWQAIKRAHLQDLFEKAQNETMTGAANVGGKFRKAVIGNTQTASRVKAALDPDEWRALKDLSDVLDAASSVKQIGSDTTWNNEIMAMARNKARPFLAKIASNLNPAQALRNFETWLTERSLAGNASRYADIITDPGNRQILRELRKLPKGSIRMRIVFGHLLTVPVRGGVEGTSPLQL